MTVFQMHVKQILAEIVNRWFTTPYESNRFGDKHSVMVINPLRMNHFLRTVKSFIPKADRHRPSTKPVPLSIHHAEHSLPPSPNLTLQSPS